LGSRRPLRRHVPDQVFHTREVCTPIFEEYVEENGMQDRLSFHAGDFFKDELPKADVVTMGHVLHDWDLETKRMLMEMEMVRHTFFFLSAMVAAVLPLAAAPQEDRRASSEGTLMYVGPYTRQESKGIYAYRYAAASGELTPIGLAAESLNPSWLLTHPDGQFLYAANESEGTVSALSIDRSTGLLTLLYRVSAGGRTPCHLVFEKTG
jgi:hypothetical protein